MDGSDRRYWFSAAVVVMFVARRLVRPANPPALLGDVDQDRAFVSNAAGLLAFLAVGLLGLVVSAVR